MLRLRRPWVTFSAEPLRPSGGAWLGLQMHPPEVEARLQAGLRLRGSCVYLALWLLSVQSLRVPLASGTAARVGEVSTIAILPLFLIRFVLCRDDLVAGRHTLYGMVFAVHAYWGWRGWLNAFFDVCEPPNSYAVIVRRIGAVVFLAVFQAFSFWQVSACLCLVMLPGTLVYQQRCWSDGTDAAALSVSAASWLPTNSTRMSLLAASVLLVALSGILHTRALSRQLVQERLNQEHARFEEFGQGQRPCIVRQHPWQTMWCPTRPLEVCRDLASLRWLLLHMARSGDWRLSEHEERVIATTIAEYLGCQVVSSHLPHHRDDPFGLCDVSSRASGSLGDDRDDFQGLRLRLWRSMRSFD